MGTRLFHILLTVKDMKRSIDFYTKAFEGAGMLYEFSIDGHDLCMFGLGNGIVLEMIEMPVVEQSDGKWNHIALECDNIQEQFERLIAAGATERPDRALSYETVLKGRNGYADTYCCGVYVYGPDGEQIELCQHRNRWEWEQPGTSCPPWTGKEAEMAE